MPTISASIRRLLVRNRALAVFESTRRGERGLPPLLISRYRCASRDLPRALENVCYVYAKSAGFCALLSMDERGSIYGQLKVT